MIEPLSGSDCLDFAMLDKIYGKNGVEIEGRYSPPKSTRNRRLDYPQASFTPTALDPRTSRVKT